MPRPTNRQQLQDLMAQRANHLTAAETARSAGDNDAFRTAMDAATGMNHEIEDLQALIAEQDRYDQANAPTFNPGSMGRRDMEEMGRILAARKPVQLDMRNFLPQLLRTNAVTVGTGSLATPTGAGSEIHSGFSAQISSLIDEVTVQDLTGLSSYEEPYVVSEMEAQVGDLATVAGNERTDTDPTFGKAPIAPCEVSVTTFVDRNLADLSAANYAEKIQTMALNALRRKANSLIMNGDGQTSPKMYGMTTAKNSEGQDIFAGANVGANITVDTLDALVFGYGGDEMVAGQARLYLTKANLKAIGALRGTNEKKRLYTITPDQQNPNTGIIADGGLIIPYTLCAAVGATKLVYANPMNYLLGLFGQYSIRVDESYQAGKRLNTILGDVKLGGNLVIDKGAFVGTLAATGA